MSREFTRACEAPWHNRWRWEGVRQAESGRKWNGQQSYTATRREFHEECLQMYFFIYSTPLQSE